MPTVIDALVVELGIDKSKFDIQRRQADQDLGKTREGMRGAAKESENLGLNLIKSFTGGELAASALTRTLTAVGAALVAIAGAKAIVHMAEQLNAADTAALRLSRTLDVSPARLQAWGALSALFGGSQANGQAAVSGVAGKLDVRLGRGDQGFIETQPRAGASVSRGTDGGIATTEEFLSRIAERMHTLAGQGEGGRMRASAMGRDLRH